MFFEMLGNSTSDFSVSNRLLADTAVHPTQLHSVSHQPYYAWQATGSQQQEQSLFQHPSHLQSYTSQTPVYHHSLLPSFEQQFNGTSQTAMNSCLSNSSTSSSVEEQFKTGDYSITIPFLIIIHSFFNNHTLFLFST